MTESQKFLDLLFGDKPDDDYILVWTLPDKKSYWFNNTEKASQMLSTDLLKKNDVYIGVGLSPERFGDFRRCPAEKITGIVGFWADIDIKGPGHKKQNLPPDINAAKKLLKRLPFKPSILIHSGHGLQAWWLFKEPWIFKDAEDRQEGAELAARWIYTLKARAAEYDWDIDATTDLARVLRIPGTYNNKEEPVPVKIIDENTNRYNPEEFEPYLVNETDKRFKSMVLDTPKSIGPLDLNPNACPPFDKWEALQIIDNQIKDSWNHKREDFQDQSASSYDMSLATYAAMAQWTDQEITNLLIAHRRKHGADLKLRQDYYARTIKKARESVARQKAEENIEEINEIAEDVKQTGTEAEKEQSRQALLKTISAMFNVRVTRIVKYISDPPQYRLETERGNIMLGGASVILSQTQFRAKMFAATDYVIPKFKRDKWDGICRTIGQACVEESLGEEATDEGTAAAWITEYLNERTIVDSIEEAAHTQIPFRNEEKKICVFGADFRKWLRVNQMEKISAKQMGAILRAYKCYPDKINVELDGTYTSRGVWVLPKKF